MGAAARARGAPLPGVGGNLAKLRAILDLARTLQSSFSVDDVLASVVDAALAITGAERGFLLLRAGEGLETRVARHARRPPPATTATCACPREVLHRALQHRRELLSMNFDPLGGEETRPQNSVADLELRSVICVPLVRIRTGQGDATSVLSTGSETVGVLYMDSRLTRGRPDGRQSRAAADAGHRSLHGAGKRAPAGGRARQAADGGGTELARTIQQSLLPRAAGGGLAARGGQQRGVARGGRRLLRRHRR